MDTIYENSQWKIYMDGDLDLMDGSYWIKSERLLEKRMGDDGLYDWPIHLAGKNWIDMECFIHAWIKAIKHNKMDVDAELLGKSIAAGYNKYIGGIAYHRDKFLYKLDIGELLAPSKPLPEDPVLLMKSMTLDFKEEDDFREWCKKKRESA